MRRESPLAPSSIARRSVRFATAALGLGLLVMGSVFPPGTTVADALPGRCEPYVQWSAGTTTTRTLSDGNEVQETSGIKGTIIQCDTIETPLPGDGGSGTGGGGGDGTAPPPGPPLPPGPALPAPPPSIPPGAAPACVRGSNNDKTPGREAGDSTGDGRTVRDNVVAGLESGTIVVDTTPAEDRLKFPGLPPTRFTSLDVKVSDSAGGNPYDGDTAEEALRSLYWPGGVDPTYTEVGPRGTALKSLVAEATKYIGGNATARSAFQRLLSNATPEVREMTEAFLRQVRYVSKTRAGSVALDLIEDLLHDLGTISGPGSSDDVELYLAMSAARTRSGVLVSGAPNGSACGQVGAGMVTDLGTSGSGIVAAGEHWVRVTLVGTEYGTLVDQLRLLRAPAGYCPPVEVEATAGQVNMVSVTSGCRGPLGRVRLLSRAETSRISSEAARELQTIGSDTVLDAGAFGAAFRRYSDLDYDPGSVKADSVSVLADGNASLSPSDDGRGVLYYKPPLEAGGGIDGLVAVATDRAGAEHYFLIKVAVKSPPTCIGDDYGGFLGEDHTTFVQHGTLQLVRNTSFTLDPKAFCSTDWRDGYRVNIETGIQGATSKVNADGTVTYSWTDPDVVGAVAPLKVTAWDEQTGAPSETVEIAVNVRDVDPVCSDVTIEYDRAAEKGTPIAVPLNCSMAGGLTVLHPPIPRLFDPSGGDGSVLTVDGGTFTASPGGLTFTPAETATGSVVAPSVTGWTLDPWAPWDVTNRHSSSFRVAVTIR
ncbi:hypothetical protein [Herbiconiux sp.]|uniref:hypothetical protein n=1 Tax=Herbiconiux sp. TaxID=1871186 RepID=UPI0025C630F3|nr:hypothetical protein [Herbiconiux sp.]